MDGDVGDQGQVITIDCSACRGTGEMSDAVPPLVRLRFFRDLTDEQRLLVFKVFGVLPEGSEGETGTHYVQGLLLKRMYAVLAAPQPAPTALPEKETPAMHDAVMEVLYRVGGMPRTRTNELWQAYRSAILAAQGGSEA
jgi:hypothetical protein